jgi:hypothetical protein
MNANQVMGDNERVVFNIARVAVALGLLWAAFAIGDEQRRQKDWLQLAILRDEKAEVIERLKLIAATLKENAKPVARRAVSLAPHEIYTEASKYTSDPGEMIIDAQNCSGILRDRGTPTTEAQLYQAFIIYVKFMRYKLNDETYKDNLGTAINYYMTLREKGHTHNQAIGTWLFAAAN